MSYRELISDYKMGHDSGDAWGSAMGAFFDLAAELYGRDDATIPDEWRYRPGAMGNPCEHDGLLVPHNFGLFVGVATADLERFGALLHRYTNLLREAGRDY